MALSDAASSIPPAFPTVIAVVAGAPLAALGLSVC